MQFNSPLSIFSAILLGAIAPLGTNALSVCRPGEIAIGVDGFCNVGNPIGGSTCDALTGTIFDHNCNSLDWSESTDYCHNGYQHHTTLNCNHDVVNGVAYNGHNYGNCYKLSGGKNNGDCSAGALEISQAYYCCVP